VRETGFDLETSRYIKPEYVVDEPQTVVLSQIFLKLSKHRLFLRLYAKIMTGKESMTLLKKNNN